MKITAKIKLLPTRQQGRMLLDTLRKANECANWLSREAWERKLFGYFSLQKILYYPAREKFGLSAQVTIRVFTKVSDAYKLDNSSRRDFREDGCIAYDDRILRVRDDATINIWTVGGRQSIPYVCGARQQQQLKSRQGESDLIYHRGKWYLGVTCNVDEPTLREVDEWLGVDLGIVNIASDSDGDSYNGGAVQGVRYRHRRLRTKLQRKGTRGARRKLRELSGREYRFAADTNHCIAKQIVAKAIGTGRGIAVENLKHIRARITARKRQRAVLHSWAFAQLRAFLEYKARLAGVPLIAVDPRNSSRECAECGHIEKSNRPSQAVFECRACGHTNHADLNASRVISGRASASKPNVAQSIAATS